MTASNQEVSLGMPQLPAPAYPAEVRTRLEADAKEVIARYPGSRSALLPLLHLVQSEEGYVSRTGMTFCAELLGLTTAEVTAVACRLVNEGSRKCARYGRVPPSLTRWTPSSPRGDSTAW